ncbi:MAG: threonine synthase [Acidobacteria bacterium]|nr:threonine synthase [Acidobacteriota bacterium]
MNSYSRLSHLQCTRCNAVDDPFALRNVCTRCQGPLYARYRLEPLSRDSSAGRSRGMWRWHEMMPARSADEIVSLGEGGTPLLEAPRLGATLGLSRLLVKEEGGNPTGSFKARGLAAAVTCAKARGAKGFAVPTAGNAGGALAAYAARAGMPAHVFMPRDTPPLFALECATYGARVILVDGLIDRCGELARALVAESGGALFDVSTLKEPYRVEGKKTMGYELAEDLGWELPDVILYPTGGGTGLLGMWKAFDEMEALGWIGSRRPRMVSVQAAGCAPVVRAFDAGLEHMEKWEGATTYASGLRVPKPYADAEILRVLSDSHGTALFVPDEEMQEGVAAMGKAEGLFAAPEGGAVWAAARRLLATGFLSKDDRVVLFDTGTGFKYVR